MMQKTKVVPEATGALQRAVVLLRVLSNVGPDGQRLTALADAAGLPRPTAHRVLKTLLAERLVAYTPARKTYTLGLDLFMLAARAGNVLGLRDIARPHVLRLTASLGETIFILVRSDYDAVCIERSAGPLPIRALTDIGGRVPLGLGQGSSAILAFLPLAEQDEIIRHNIPSLMPIGLDEASLRAWLATIRRTGYAEGTTGVNPGMAGLGVPILGHDGNAVACLSIGSTTDRLTPERNPVVAEIVKRSAGEIAEQLNPFDPVLRRAAAAME
jgi:DNA-binding IclR family transcriptional regulator